MAPSVPAETPWASLKKSASTCASTASGVVRWAAAMALMGLPSATIPNSDSSAGVRPPWVATGRIRASTIEGSSAVPPVATARTASTSWFPSAMWSLRR